MTATVKAPCRPPHMINDELYQPLWRKSCPPEAVIRPRMISGLSDAWGTFEHEVLLTRTEDVAGGQESAILCLCLRNHLIQCGYAAARRNQGQILQIRHQWSRMINFIRISQVGPCLLTIEWHFISQTKTPVSNSAIKILEKFILIKICCWVK